MARRQDGCQRKVVSSFISHAFGAQRFDRTFRFPKPVNESGRLGWIVRDQGPVRRLQSSFACLSKLEAFDACALQLLGMSDPKGLKTFIEERQGGPGLLLNIVTEFCGCEAAALFKHVRRSPKPGGTDICEGHRTMLGRNFPSYEAVLNLDGDTARPRKIFGMEAEDRNVAFVQFKNDSICVDIEFVSNNQYGIRHCSSSILAAPLGDESQEQKLLGFCSCLAGQISQGHRRW